VYIAQEFAVHPTEAMLVSHLAARKATLPAMAREKGQGRYAFCGSAAKLGTSGSNSDPIILRMCSLLGFVLFAPASIDRHSGEVGALRHEVCEVAKGARLS
jgi:hypothetical protein